MKEAKDRCAYLVTSSNFHSMVIYETNDLFDLQINLSQMHGIDLEEVEIKRITIHENDEATNGKS